MLIWYARAQRSMPLRVDESFGGTLASEHNERGQTARATGKERPRGPNVTFCLVHFRDEVLVSSMMMDGRRHLRCWITILNRIPLAHKITTAFGFDSSPHDDPRPPRLSSNPSLPRRFVHTDRAYGPLTMCGVGTDPPGQATAAAALMSPSSSAVATLTAVLMNAAAEATAASRK